MIEYINRVNEIGFSTFLICIILAALIIIGAKELGGKVLVALGLRTNKSIEKEKLTERLDNMQKEIDKNRNIINEYKISSSKQYEEWHQQSINIRNNLELNQSGLKEDIQSLTNMFKEFAKKEDENTVAMFRSSLWRLHKDLTTQGFVTPDGLKTFMEMGKIYERCGGDDIYHDKLLPEVESLEIHYPDGSIYNQK